jgi:hypothetical protein
MKLRRNLRVFKQKNLYLRSLFIRGIGYRMFIMEQPRVSEQSFSHAFLYKKDNKESFGVFNEFKNKKYLILRAGHSTDLIQPIPKNIFVKALKKDRKLVVFGRNKNIVSNFCRYLRVYRLPSVYTGRGIKQKYIKVLKKIGKKDKQKGKIF